MNRQRFRDMIVGGIIVGTITLGINPVIAQGFTKTIKATFNSVNIVLDEKKVNADNIIYNGTTYVPLRAMSEMLGREVTWNEKTKTANIGVNNFSKSPEELNQYYKKEVSIYKEKTKIFDKFYSDAKQGLLIDEEIEKHIKETVNYRDNNFICRKSPEEDGAIEYIHRVIKDAYSCYEEALNLLNTSVAYKDIVPEKQVLEYMEESQISYNEGIYYIAEALRVLENEK